MRLEETHTPPAILVIEDDTTIRTLLQAVLEDEGYHVELASDGRMALRNIEQRTEPYDVILLDLVLPSMHGFCVLDALQRQAHVRRDAVIVHSADLKALRQARRQGIRYCLTKPFELETFLTVVLSVCARHPLSEVHTA